MALSEEVVLDFVLLIDEIVRTIDCILVLSFHWNCLDN